MPVFITRSNTLWRIGLVHQIIGHLCLVLQFCSWYLCRYFTPALGCSYFTRWVSDMDNASDFQPVFSTGAIGIVIGIMVLVFWFGASCMRTWHGYGLSIGLSDPSLFTSYTKACALCPITQRCITSTLHRATLDYISCSKACALCYSIRRAPTAS